MPHFERLRPKTYVNLSGTSLRNEELLQIDVGQGKSVCRNLPPTGVYRCSLRHRLFQIRGQFLANLRLMISNCTDRIGFPTPLTDFSGGR